MRRPRREGAGSTLPELEGGRIVTCSEDACERPVKASGLCSACYSAHRCRCDGCRDANVTYETKRARQKAYGKATMVDAAPVLEHVRRLSNAGLGKVRLAQLSGVSETAILKLKRGSKRVRKDTADAILSVEMWQAERSPVGLARIGRNSRCVDCSAAPLFGGLRCLRHFQLRVLQNRGEHITAERPSVGSYQAGCRCRDCRAASASARKQLRNQHRAAA